MKINTVIKPNSKNDLVELVNDVYYVRTKAPAVEGKANTAAVALIAKHFKMPKSHVKIVRGATSRNKVIEITP